MPELLAAFSMPNDPVIDRILHNASELLRKAGKPAEMNGYESHSRGRVWEMVNAIYAAVANIGISYAMPPASFERDGQKIRLPARIIDGKVATCLDTTMLLVAAFEQAGLNPIIALPQGHALAGAWLQPEKFSAIVTEGADAAEALRKRHDLKELVLIETTLATSRPAPPFSRAVEQALNACQIDKDGSFNAVVDIRQARAHRINPLGIKSGHDAGAGTDGPEGPTVEIGVEMPPPLPDFDLADDENVPLTPDERIDRWQRKLLDLSARNPLLNHKSTKSSLPIFCPDPGALEDRLAADAKISVLPFPQPTAASQDQELHTQRTGQSITKEYAAEQLQDNRILVDLPKQELAKRAVQIYRKAQTALQEGGSNTLYLALGFLLWRRNENDARKFRAPLILLPVTLQRPSILSGFKMLAHDDEPRFNTTLLEMLRKDFEIEIRGLDGQLPTDTSGIDVWGIWNKVRRAVVNAPGFEVVDDVVLGHFSFAKYLMWKDLTDRTDALRQNPVVKHLIDTPREPYQSAAEFVPVPELDRKFAPSDLLMPLPADSSQMAAIAAADECKDLIVIGPPGTGKSQTISNMIAHLLGVGKSVLFVSAKTAALEVGLSPLERSRVGTFLPRDPFKQGQKGRGNWAVG